MDADVFARKALDAVARNEAIIVLPQWWRALWYLDRISPALSAQSIEVTQGRSMDDVIEALERCGREQLSSESRANDFALVDQVR